MAYHENSRKTFIAAGPIPRDSLVKLTAAGLDVCGAGEVPVGVTEVGALAAGEHVGVRLLNTPGTLEVACGAAVTLGQLLSSGEAGAVAPHSGSAPLVGMALQTGGSGGLVEIMPVFNPIPAAGATNATNAGGGGE